MTRAAPGARELGPDTAARRLREQAPDALCELLRGFQEASPPELGLFPTGSPRERQHLHAGLVTALLRLVVVLYAEARGLLSWLPGGGAPLAQLLAQLERDRRWGADLERRETGWPRLVALFRALHGWPAPASERGGFFDPDAYPFLEGRPRESRGVPIAALSLPRISDGVVLRVLSRLMMPDGAPVRYGELEIEHIGTLYEGLIGLDLEIAEGESMAVLPSHVVINLESLLALPGEARLALLRDTAELKLGARLAARVSAASTLLELSQALSRRASPRLPRRVARGTLYLQPGQLRRRAGSYYTPREITRQVVERALAPLLEPDGRPAAPDDILSLAVCDPAMGSGAFLLEACRQLAERLAAAWQRTGTTPRLAPGEPASHSARVAVAQRCLHGVDLDPLAVDLARLSLWLFVREGGLPPGFLDRKLRCGNSLIGAFREEIAVFPAGAASRGPASEAQARRARARRPPGDPAAGDRAAGDPAAGEDAGLSRAAFDAWTALWFWRPGAEHACAAPTPDTFASYMAAACDPADPRAALARGIAEERRFLHWELAFRAVFDRSPPGFDAVIGNPPWVAYVGRAAQPIEPDLFNFYVCKNPAFHGYRSLHGLFVQRSASLLRTGGRLGLVVPTSVADLEGYAPARRAHDALCVVDPDLPSFGSDAFEGVFQPSMGLLSTRAVSVPAARSGPWQLARSDLDTVAQRLLERLGTLRRLPATLFGERGFQTSAEDAEHIRRTGVPIPPYTCPLREGSDIGELVARAPRHHIDRAALKGRFRPDEDWRAVKLLIRQTARYPIAALSDGVPFRNSILAGFRSETWSEFALLCYLNSSPVRWWHYVRHRDAREGMPQVKIAHLRAIPAPVPARAGMIAALDALGREIGPANAGLPEDARRKLEDVVASMLELTEDERRCVARWAAANPLPRPDG